MKNFVIAAQLYTVRDLLKDKTDEEVKSVLKSIRDMGYTAVQISGIGPITSALATLYAETCASLGLQICATHVSLADLESDFDWIVTYHRQWNCRIVGIGIMPEAYRHSEGVKEFADKCNTIGRKLKEQGITLVYHNHKLEFEKAGDNTWMSLLFDAFDPNAVEFEIDTYWVQAGGANPEKWIRQVNGRMTIVHLKDFRIVNDQQQFAEIGAGNLDWPSIWLACEETAVQYAAIEQDAFTENPLQSLEQSLRYVETHLVKRQLSE